MAELRAQGRYGPGLREVLPAFVVLGLALLCTPLALVTVLRRSGPGALAVAVALLAALVGMWLTGRRALVHRRQGLYTPTELSRLSRRGLALAVERMLRRDGWQVTDLSDAGGVRLYARDAEGRELDVVVRASIDIPPGENVAGAGSPDATVRTGGDRSRLVVHRGSFSRADVQWASHQPRVRLVDGVRLNRWASGTPLLELGPPL
ncbi:hypothetical protein [Streptomyces sp. NPDC016845]|uniref:hypothetical protein n=1 Tax=Streptomyces sp. NPDC016845 TaxID=3364972 RepID=UPI0037A5F44C